MKITAVILTKNEEKNLERCLKSILFCDEIVIVDDFSTDKTLNQISKIKNQNDKLNIKIFRRKLNNDFAGQRNFGMSKASNEWVLFVDADEEISKKLKEEILSLDPDLRRDDSFADAYFIKRRDFFWGKELKFGEIRSVRLNGLIRLVRKDSGKWMGNVHEVFHTARNAGILKGFLNHYPHQTLKKFIEDINYYSSLRAKELYNQGKKTNIFEIITWPIGKFIYNYFINLGFLDGPPGFTYSFLMSFHSFLVRAKLWQYYST